MAILTVFGCHNSYSKLNGIFSGKALLLSDISEKSKEHGSKATGVVLPMVP